MSKLLTWLFTLLLTATAVVCVSDTGTLITEAELKARIEEAAKDLQDISMVGTVTFKNKKALAKIDANYSRLYDFKSATVVHKSPDKFRMDGKLGMVRFEYIISGGHKIVRAPSIRFTKKEDYSDDPAKLQDALDIGLITPSLWHHRKVEIIDDPEAAAVGEIKARLRWPKGDMIHYVWIDQADLYLKRFEKRDPTGKLLFRVEYSEPRQAGGVIWMPTKVEVFSADGERAGASEYSDIKTNMGVQDSFFE